MKSSITAGMNEQERKELESEFSGSFYLRSRIIELLTKDIHNIQKDMTSDEHYSSPNWNLIQVDRIAQIKAIEKIISLLS